MLAALELGEGTQRRVAGAALVVRALEVPLVRVSLLQLLVHQ